MSGFINNSGVCYDMKKMDVSIDKLCANSTYYNAFDNASSNVETVDIASAASDVASGVADSFKNAVEGVINLLGSDSSESATEPTIPEQLATEHEITESNTNDAYDEYSPTEPVLYDNYDELDYSSGTSFINIKPNDICNQLAGSCETDDYIIASYKNTDDSLQQIVIYSKKDNKPIRSFVTDKLHHTNGLTTDGKNVYIANAETGKDNSPSNTEISSFSIDDVLSRNEISLLRDPIVEVSSFNIASGDNSVKNFTSIGYDVKSGTIAVACGNNLYIVKGNKLIKIKKLYYENKFADTNQDICVAKNSVYVIRTHCPTPPDANAKPRDLILDDNAKTTEYNVVDIYDTDGNYKGTKKIDIPITKDDKGRVYRELESLSYDEDNDCFTLYFNNPYKGASAPHVIVRGVKMEGASDITGTPNVRSNYYGDWYE